MKIIGFTYLDGKAQMVLRADSCLLNGKKPFFLPETSKDVRAHRCVVLRVSRLGKNIKAKFATRYYDAWAPGLDIIAYDLLQEARRQGDSWTSAIAFDYALPLGEFSPCDESGMTEEAICNMLCIYPNEAIAQVSSLMTIRQGDLLYIDYADEAIALQRDNVINGPTGHEDKFYCKIK